MSSTNSRETTLEIGDCDSAEQNASAERNRSWATLGLAQWIESDYKLKTGVRRAICDSLHSNFEA
jgi:hypothetical protein